MPARILEIISPGGFEEAFREIDAYGDEMNPQLMAKIAAKYRIEVNFEETGSIIERHGLTF